MYCISPNASTMFTYLRRAGAWYQGNRQNCMEAAKMTVGTNFGRSRKARLRDIGLNIKRNSQILLITLFFGCRFHQMAVFCAAASPSEMPCASYNSSLLDQTKFVCLNHQNVLSNCHPLIVAAGRCRHNVRRCHKQPENNSHPRQCVDFDDNALKHTAELASNQERFR